MTHPAGVFALSLFSLTPFTGLELLKRGMASKVNGITQSMETDCYRAGTESRWGQNEFQSTL